MSIYSNYDKNAPSIGERGLIHGYISVDRGDQHQTRITDIVYSRDLIELNCCNDMILTYYGNDLTNILMMPKDNQLSKNLLTKVRLVSITENPKNRLLTPLTYQSDIFIEFNQANEPSSRRFDHNKQLHVSSGGQNDIFKIYNVSNPNDTDAIHLGDQIVIARSLKNNDTNIYLVVNNDGTITTDGPANNATHFTINSSIGCGPNWFYDQDTRGLHGQKFSQSDLQEMAIEATQRLSGQLQKQQNQLTDEEEKFQLECDEKISREKRINDELKKELKQFYTEHPSFSPPHVSS